MEVSRLRAWRGDLPRTPRLALLRDRSPCTWPDMAASGSAMRSSSRKGSRSDDHRPCMRARAGAVISSTASRSAGTPSSWDRERSGCPDGLRPPREPVGAGRATAGGASASELDPTTKSLFAVRFSTSWPPRGHGWCHPRGFRLRLERGGGPGRGSRFACRADAELDRAAARCRRGCHWYPPNGDLAVVARGTCSATDAAGSPHTPAEFDAPAVDARPRRELALSLLERPLGGQCSQRSRRRPGPGRRYQRRRRAAPHLPPWANNC